MEKDWEIQCYGCTANDLEKSVLRSLRMVGNSPQMIATSILSDVQEEIERGLNEQARQDINRAKWIINQNWQKIDDDWVLGK